MQSFGPKSRWVFTSFGNKLIMPICMYSFLGRVNKKKRKNFIAKTTNKLKRWIAQKYIGNYYQRVLLCKFLKYSSQFIQNSLKWFIYYFWLNSIDDLSRIFSLIINVSFFSLIYRFDYRWFLSKYEFFFFWGGGVFKCDKTINRLS